ncbi:MAG: signal peptidase II [Solirubrobacterales bacterium]
MKRHPWRPALAVCALVVIADQASKAAIRANLVPGETVSVVGPLELTRSRNTGVAFGLAGGGGLGIVLLAVGAMALIGYLFARNPSRPGMWLAAGLLAGGAIGNLIDRVRDGAVTDFIDLPLWPAFNVADIAITAGVATLAWILLSEPPGER